MRRVPVPATRLPPLETMMPDGLQTPSSFTVSTGPLPASRKIYVAGAQHPDLRVPMREVTVGGGEPAVRIYDPSGPYSDANVKIDVRKGLAKLRAGWIDARGDVETYQGRDTRPED